MQDFAPATTNEDRDHDGASMRGCVRETEKVVKDIYEKTPFTKKYFQKRKTAVSSPVDLVPHDMLDIRSQEIGEGRLYCLTFRKP